MIKYMQIKITTKHLFSMLAARSCLFATPRTVASQAPLFMEFSRQEYWSGLPFPSPGDLLNPGIELRSPALQADSLPLSHQGSSKYLFSWSDWQIFFPLFFFFRMILLLFGQEVVSNSFATPWTVTHQASLSMGFPRQEYWSGLPFPSPGDLPFSTTEPPGKPRLTTFFKFGNLWSWQAIFKNINSQIFLVWVRTGTNFLESNKAIMIIIWNTNILQCSSNSTASVVYEYNWMICQSVCVCV